MDIVCKVVESKSELKAFINFPHDLYKDDQYYVPELYLGQLSRFNRKVYPFFKYGDARLFLAYQHQKILGRIAAIHNPRYNEYHRCHVAFFGFFDCVNDNEIAQELFKKVREYAIEKGHTSIMGPTNFTTNETAGILVEGFESSPMVMMTYNYPYYNELLLKCGYQKEMDLLAYHLQTESTHKKSSVLQEKIQNRLLHDGISIRKVTSKSLHKDAVLLKKVYNQAWEKNWGFVPFTDEEFVYLKNELINIVDPKFTYVAEKNGKPIGFSITIPDINYIFKKNKRGRLFPFGIFRYLFGKKKIPNMRVLALGVIPGYRKQGIEGIFFALNIAQAIKKNIAGVEASWILENNQEMNLSLQKLGGIVYKKYRLYRLEL